MCYSRVIMHESFRKFPSCRVHQILLYPTEVNAGTLVLEGFLMTDLQLCYSCHSLLTPVACTMTASPDSKVCRTPSKSIFPLLKTKRSRIVGQIIPSIRGSCGIKLCAAVVRRATGNSCVLSSCLDRRWLSVETSSRLAC